MIGLLFVLAAVGAWVLLSLTATFLTNPITWYSLMQSGRANIVTKFAPVPCFAALMDEQERQREEDLWASYSKNKNEEKRRIRLRRAVNMAFLFSLPERLEFRAISKTCAASSFENAKTRAFHQSQWLEDTSEKRVHGCHDLGHLPERALFSQFIRDVMGYDNLTNLFSYQSVYYTAGKVRGINKKNVDNVMNPNLLKRARVLIKSCQSFEEADAVASVLLGQVDEEDGVEESQKRLVERNLLSDDNIAVVTTSFRERVLAFPEVPLEIHAQMALSAEGT